jgi:Putative Ig domain
MKPNFIITFLCSLVLLSGSQAGYAQTKDIVIFGDSLSETAHKVVASNTRKITGNLNQPARQCLAPATSNIYGGSITFTMSVDSVYRNYVSLKFWGGDDGTLTSSGRLYLYIIQNGINYQVGYRHEGDYITMSLQGNKPPLPNRFFYSTTLLPLAFTKGKTSITLRVVSTGRLYGLGSGTPPNGNYQYYMTEPSRAIYRGYTHIDPYLDVSSEPQGTAPKTTVLPTPTESIMQRGGAYFNAVNNRIRGLLTTPARVTSFNTETVEYLAQSYFLPNMAGYNNINVVNKVTAVIDAYAADFYNDNNAVFGGTNEGWGGRYGYLGYAIYLLRNQLATLLDAPVNFGGEIGIKSRREAWGDILVASRDSGRTHRRFITNQAILTDASIYKANKGLLALGDKRAMPEPIAQRYLLECIGLSPWLGSDIISPNSSDLIVASNYYQVTKKGLSREPGYVGLAYGEMQPAAALFYKYTGNEVFKKQAIKMLKARAPFRRPAPQQSGTNYYTAMEGIGLLAWRGVAEVDGNYANTIAYGDRIGNAGPLFVAAATLDSTCIAYAKQCLKDNQFFAHLTTAYASTLHGLDVFEDYHKVVNAYDNGLRLPMTQGQKDFVWSDEESGILAVMKNNERLWIEPYWQAKNQSGINGIARFHYSASNYDQYGVLETTPSFTYAGIFITRPNFVDGMGANVYTPPDNPTNAYAGERLPVAANGLMNPPSSITNSSPYQPFVGKADAYAFRYGKFLIGMNCSETKKFTLRVPKGFVSATDLVSSSTVNADVTLNPLNTAVLYLNNNIDTAPYPATPLLLYITFSNSTTARLAWRSASGATTYRLKRATSPGGPYTTIATALRDTFFTNTNLVAGRIYYYVVSAVNANGESYNSMEVSTVGYRSNTPQITNAITDTAYLGVPYTFTVAAFSSPSRFGANGLPSGLSINTLNGIISGIPTVSGQFSVPLTASNGIGTGAAVLTIVVVAPNVPKIISADTVRAYVNVPFSYQIEATNSPSKFYASNLPSGFTIDTISGTIKGTPGSTNAFTFNVIATNNSGSSSQLVVVNVSQPPIPVIINASTATGIVSKDFYLAINTVNSPTVYRASGLPAGLAIDSIKGVITGVPTSPGTFSVALSAANASGTGRLTITLYVLEAPPSPWVDSNVGNGGGYAAYASATGAFTVTGSGTDISGRADAFNYLYMPVVCSTFTSITARISSRQLAAGSGGSPKDKIGLMMRESLDSNSNYYFVALDAQRNVFTSVRTTNGGSASTVTAMAMDIPVWLRIEREGNTFTAYATFDTTAWETVATATFNMKSNMLVGMAVVSRNTNLTTAVFDSVAVASDCALLPLSVTGFTASKQNDYVLIKWKAHDFEDISHFIIKKGINGIDFTEVALIDASKNNNSTFSWIDQNPSFENNNSIYYKLIAVDKSGKTTDFGARIVKSPSNTKQWLIYPNPGGRYRSLKNATNRSQNAQLLCTDITGRIIWRKEKTVAPYSAESIDLGGDLTKGIYWLRINDEVVKIQIDE